MGVVRPTEDHRTEAEIHRDWLMHDLRECVPVESVRIGREPDTVIFYANVEKQVVPNEVLDVLGNYECKLIPHSSKTQYEVKIY